MLSPFSYRYLYTPPSPKDFAAKSILPPLKPGQSSQATGPYQLQYTVHVSHGLWLTQFAKRIPDYVHAVIEPATVPMVNPAMGYKYQRRRL